VQQRLPRRYENPVLFAHRGARAHCPENTLPGFLLALKLGANGIETDAWLTRDGVIVLDHDGFRGSRISKRWIRDYSYHELPFEVVRLDDLLNSLVPETYRLSIDVKDESAFDAIVELITDRELGHLVYLCHPQLTTLKLWLHRHGNLKLVHSTRYSEIKNAREMHAAELSSLGIEACNMHHSDWNGGLVALYHRFGVAAFAWDVQYRSTAETMLLMGIDAIYGDDVEILHESLASVSAEQQILFREW
jgi:glycerophosphoryl diester phosphodiesterase